MFSLQGKPCVLKMVDLGSSHSSDVLNSLKPYDITVKKYLSQQSKFTGVVGAAIIIYDNRVLLLQRATDDDCPNVWEVPGGGANGDETLVQCDIRELREETGLAAHKVLQMVAEFSWEARSSSDDSEAPIIWKIFMFLATVEDLETLEIQLDHQEHQAYLWATEDDIRKDSCGGIQLQWVTTNQNQAILMVFEKNWAESIDY